VDAARRYRMLVVPEDADDECVVWVPECEPESTECDISESWPEWTCECGSHMDGHRLNCLYCGAWREDVDQCG